MAILTNINDNWSSDISSTETEEMWKMLISKHLGVVKSIISDLGKLCDADKVVAAKEPECAAASLDLQESTSHLSDELSAVETNKQRIVKMETIAICRTSGPAFCRPVRRLIYFWFDLVLGRGLGER